LHEKQLTSAVVATILAIEIIDEEEQKEYSNGDVIDLHENWRNWKKI
jgi:hypothetical protein